MGPVIDRLYRRYHRMAQEELARTRGKLSGELTEQDEAHLEDLVRRVVNKLLHDPVQVLRQGESAGAHTPPGGYLHAFQKLFQVGDGMEGDADGGRPGQARTCRRRGRAARRAADNDDADHDNPTRPA